MESPRNRLEFVPDGLGYGVAGDVNRLAEEKNVVWEERGSVLDGTILETQVQLGDGLGQLITGDVVIDQAEQFHQLKIRI